MMKSTRSQVTSFFIIALISVSICACKKSTSKSLKESKGKIEIHWGTTDTIITSMQTIYCWVLFRNTNSDGIIKLDNERSKIDVLVRTDGKEVSIGMISLYGEEMSLRPNNSLISHFATGIGREFMNITKPTSGELVMRPQNGDIIIDSTRKIKIIPPANKATANWFITFDSLVHVYLKNKSDTTKEKICAEARIRREKTITPETINSIIDIASTSNYGSLCDSTVRLCYKPANFTTEYAVQYGKCISNACADIKTSNDFTNLYCPELFHARNRLTFSVLKSPNEIPSDLKDYHRFVGRFDTTYYSDYLYTKRIK